MDLQKAYQKCQRLADEHYENFPVARLVPKAIRKHVAAVYAFARTADDIADEDHETLAADSPLRIERLNAFCRKLDDSLKQPPVFDAEHEWIFAPVADTIRKFCIPPQLFKDLVSAFAQDVVKKRYADFEELLDYCRRSANPVGRLVLLLHGFKDEERFALSDKICTALQLANFWQDISVDKTKGRIYVPITDWGGLTEEDFLFKPISDEMRACIKSQVERTQKMFDEGKRLFKKLHFPLSLEIKITVAGGMGILEKIRSQNFDTITRRPKFSKADKLRLLLKSLF